MNRETKTDTMSIGEFSYDRIKCMLLRKLIEYVEMGVMVNYNKTLKEMGLDEIGFAKLEELEKDIVKIFHIWPKKIESLCSHATICDIANEVYGYQKMLILKPEIELLKEQMIGSIKRNEFKETETLLAQIKEKIIQAYY